MEIIRLDKDIEDAKLSDILIRIAKLEEETFGEGSWDLDYFREILNNDFDLFYVVFNYQKVCAYGIIRALLDADILSIAVREDMRRKGLGHNLLKKMLLGAFKHGSRRVFLEVRSRNIPAIKLYDGIGFELVGIRKGYYSSPNDDALLMRYTC